MSLLKDRIKAAMEKRNITSPTVIAQACGVKPPSVLGWISGDTASLKGETARRAGELFRCDRDWIGSGRGSPGWYEDDERVEPVDASARPTLAEALEVVGAAVAVDMPEPTRNQVADSMALMTRGRGARPFQELILKLLEPQLDPVPEPAQAAPPPANQQNVGVSEKHEGLRYFKPPKLPGEAKESTPTPAPAPTGKDRSLS